MKRFLTFLSIIMIIAITTDSAWSAKKSNNKQIDLGNPLPPNSIYKLYRNRTWIWSNGAAYFKPNGAFFAYTNGEKGANYATGKWRSLRKGKMCFKATWVSEKSKEKHASCFQHYYGKNEKKSIINQRHLPSGHWYIFKHNNSHTEDEFNKLILSNVRAKQFEKIRELIEQKR